MLLWFTAGLRLGDLLLGERVRGEKGNPLLPLRLPEGLALTAPAADPAKDSVGVEAAAVALEEGSNLTTLRGARRDRPPDSLAVGDTIDGGAKALGVQGDSGRAPRPPFSSPLLSCAFRKRGEGFARLARGAAAAS